MEAAGLEGELMEKSPYLFSDGEFCFDMREVAYMGIDTAGPANRVTVIFKGNSAPVYFSVLNADGAKQMLNTFIQNTAKSETPL
jgi:hypothetical protein